MRTHATNEHRLRFGLGKLELPGIPALYLPGRIQCAGLTILPIVPAHTYGVFSHPNHHQDPFDRLLIAQAQAESLTVVTNDRIFAKYDANRFAA